ncbi:hypothetical protein HHI36_014948 [Cryptolaemus montrouzieri]|uniref:Uncharacterized protein n=1 Tax=Cryptolaemus montrouzieri TaxID=559131 RepID=A0ABD2N464_9CUCU
MLHMAKTFLAKREPVVYQLKFDTKIREVVLTEEDREKVNDSFQRDDVNRMCTGKRDFVKRNGIKKQKRLLLFTVRELTSKFFEETRINLPYVTLLREKSFCRVAPTFRGRESYLCVKHENLELKPNESKNLHQLVFTGV